MGRHFERGMALFELRRFREAIEEFSQELADDPQSALALAMRAACLGSLAKNRQAQQDARAAIELDPECDYAFYALSIIYMCRGRQRAAHKMIREALRIAPLPDYFQQLGDIHFREKRFRQSLDATEKALSLNPQHEPALILRAKALVKLGRLAEARKLLREALALSAENPEAHRELGALILRTRGTEKALNHLLEARRIDPIGFNDRIALASAYGRMLWPISIVDSWLGWMRNGPITRRWIAVTTVLTALNVMLLIVKPSTEQFSPTAAIVIVAVTNLVALFASLDWIATFVAKIALRKQLDLRWYHYFLGLDTIIALVTLHTIATFPPLLLIHFPKFVFVVSSCLANWDLFALTARLPIILAPIAFLVGGAMVLYLAFLGSQYMPEKPLGVAGYWAAIVALSASAMFLRIRLGPSQPRISDL